MKSRRSMLTLLGAGALSLAGMAGFSSRYAVGETAPRTLLNVSYDPTREMYAEINEAFLRRGTSVPVGDRHVDMAEGVAARGEVESLHVPDLRNLTILQSHGGSGKQARSIIEGLPADVATLALASDTDALHRKAGLIPAGWQKRLPDNSSPYTSTIVLVVRRGNPRGIRDWGDLVRRDVSVITPNPKTSGGARWNYLAAWGFARQHGGSDVAAADFMRQLMANVPMLAASARGASIAFVRRNLGDVFLSWENEAWLLERELPGSIEIIYPSMSILAEPAVTLVDRNVDRHGTREIAEAYLRFLYADEGQEIIGRHHFRPRERQVAERMQDRLPAMNLFTIDEAFGGWTQANRLHFAEGASFDRIHEPG